MKTVTLKVRMRDIHLKDDCKNIIVVNVPYKTNQLIIHLKPLNTDWRMPRFTL